MIKELRRLYDAFNTVIGLLSGITVIFIGFILFAEVVCRRAGHPTEWIPEWSGYLFFWAILGGASYTLSKGRHVRVELLFMHLSPTVRNLLDVFVSLVGAAFCILVAFQGWEHLVDVIETGETTPTTLRIPLWLTDFPLFFGFSLLAVQFLLIAADRAVGVRLLRLFQTRAFEGDIAQENADGDASGKGGAL